jgi:hypothetical protein
MDGPVSLRGPDVRTDEFDALLGAIARIREHRHRRDPVVIVIDGLDEVRTVADRGNVLGLPERPPDGVYFIVSQRPGHVLLRRVNSRWLCPLETDDERHLDDLRVYLQTACTRPKIASALQNAGVAEAELVDSLTKKSGGVWLYVHHILDEIEREQRDLSNLADLPAGLWEFYAEQCDGVRARQPERWEHYDLPVLSTLAAAQEPLGQPTLAALAAVEDSQTLDDVIDTWAPFLEHHGHPPYRLYHDSMGRFVSGEVAHELRAHEARVARRLASATYAAHLRIADRYLQLWGGLSDGLPNLRDPQRATTESGYGVRQLAVHLHACERYDELRALLLAEWPAGPRPLNAWYEAHAQAGNHVRYMADVTRARQLAETRTDRALPARRRAVTAGDEYGYALLAGSIHSHSGNVPPQLRTALVRHGVWTTARAIADAQHLADPTARAEALGALVEHLSDDEREPVLAEALTAARQNSNEHSRARELVALAQHFRDDERERVLGEALTAARQISNEHSRADALGALAEHLGAHQLGEALIAAREISNEGARARALVALVEQFSDDERERTLGEALIAARQISDEHSRADALGALAEHLGAHQLGEALIAARQISNKGARADALRALAECFSDDERDRVLGEALTAARQIRPSIASNGSRARRCPPRSSAGTAW